MSMTAERKSLAGDPAMLLSPQNLASIAGRAMTKDTFSALTDRRYLLSHIAALTPPAEGDVGALQKRLTAELILGWGGSAKAITDIAREMSDLLSRLSADRDKWKFCVERFEERAIAAERARDEAVAERDAMREALEDLEDCAEVRLHGARVGNEAERATAVACYECFLNDVRKARAVLSTIQAPKSEKDKP
jgi:hypothetical protein